MNPVSKFTPKLRREKTKVSNSDLSDGNNKDVVQVFCRLCPIRDEQQNACVKLLSPTTLALSTPTDFKGGKKEVHCKFKHIFTSYSTQNEVFEHVAYPLLEDLLKGKNGLLFTYGVTGSGKTYTLTGVQENPGIIPKCVNTIFNTITDYQAPKFTIKSDKMNGFEIQSKEDVMHDKLADLRSQNTRTPIRNQKRTKDSSYINDGIKILDIDESCLYSVFVSYIEIYNNTVYDLLDESGPMAKGAPSKILREDSQKNMYVNGVVEMEVKSAEEAFQVFNFGRNRKKMGNTLLNSVSSRSHSIFNIRVVQFQQTMHNSDGKIVIPHGNLLKIGRLSLVDLAGSERTNRTQNTGLLLKEASKINNSLMSLRTCLDILRENQLTGSNRLVPYRDSRLTLLFRNYFEGDGRIEMIVCVNPSADDFEENLQVMKFAENTQDVKVARSEAKFTPCKKTIQKKAHTPGIKQKLSSGSFAFGPKLPEISLQFQNEQEAGLAYQKLEAILSSRLNRLQTTIEKDLESRELHLRKRLVDVHKEHLLNTADLKSTKILLRKEKSKSGQLEQKLCEYDAIHNNLMHKNEELRSTIRQLKNTINEKDLKINKEILANEKTKQKMILENEKRDHELDEKLRRQREHLHAAMKTKDSKLQKVRDILDKELTPPEIKDEPMPLKEVNALLPLPPQTPKQNQYRRNAATPAAARHRRSRSAGEMWLEHNAVKPVPLGTVLQPSMKKRKSVTKLTKAADITNPKQSKYCLIAQEQDTDGEVETKLYKGDILPTCGGGAQVVFNDVEKLRQESPTK